MNTRNEQMSELRAGQVKEISSTSNPIIKEVKGLALKKNRDAQNRFLAEGQKLVIDAIDLGWKMPMLIFGKHMNDQQHMIDLVEKAKANGAQILEVSEKVLSAISRRDNPQMVIGVFEQQWYDGTHFDTIAQNAGDVIVALDRVRDPGNLGTIMRTADAAGAKGIILIDDTVDPFSVEAVRATMGSIFNIKLCQMTSDEFISWQNAFSGNIVGTHLKGAVDYRTVEFDTKPNILLMGNEQKGLPDELAEKCDHLVFIPMAGKADSLNLAISTGVMLFEMRRSFLKMSDIQKNGDV